MFTTTHIGALDNCTSKVDTQARMGTLAPQDTILVHQAVRLGWTLAEVGGRYRRLAATGHPTPRIELGPDMLPLAVERSEQEQAIQAEQSLRYISRLMKLDPPASCLSQMPKGVQGTASEYLRVTGQPLTKAAQPSAARTKRAEGVDHILAVWDAHMQDLLHGQSLAAHAGYQVGRAFAEVNWSLPPSDCDPAAASRVLGSERRDALAVLLRSLSAYFDPLCLRGVVGSFSAWTEFVANTANSGVIISEKVHEQTLIWRSLLAEEADPKAWLKSESPARWAHTTWAVLGSFQLALVVSLVSAAALVGGAVLLAWAGSGGFLGAGVGILGLLGITAAGILARAKDISEGVLARIHTQTELDLITGAITRLPLPGNPSKG